MRIVAIDQGTTSTRAIVLESGNRLTVAHSVCHQQHYPQPHWVEHDAEQLLTNIRQCLDIAGPADCVGMANQGESCLAWHAKTGKALSPVIVWQDQRTRAVIHSMKNNSLEAETLQRAGLPLDPYFSAAKFGWMLNNLPQVRAALQQGQLRLGTTDAFFLDRLTGRFITDITTASRTSLMNLQTGQWDPELCKLFDVPLNALPEITSTTGQLGTLTTSHGTLPLTASVVDQQAALYGFGCTEPGDTKFTFGTGAFALQVTGTQIHRPDNKGLLPTVAWRKHDESPVYALDGGILTASASINWARQLGLFTQLDDINRFAKGPAIERGLVFVPALSGLGCPHWRADVRGQWLGLSIEHTQAELMQSILEGVAFRAAEVLGALQQASPDRGPVSIDGGMSKNPYFCQFLANILNRAVDAAKVPELTGLGTALLAAHGAGLSASFDRQVLTYWPTADLSAFRHRFATAVSLASHWSDGHALHNGQIIE